MAAELDTDPAQDLIDGPPAVPASPRRRRWYRRAWPWISIGVVVLLVVGAGAFFVLRSGARAASLTQVYQVTPGAVQQTVSASGTIEPATRSDLSFTSSGTVTGVDVQVGQKVTAGQPLAAIDPTSLTSDVSLAQAQVTQAEAEVTSASGGSATVTASAAAQLASAQAKLQSAQSALTAATLTSPIDGVVASVSVAVGDQVGGSSSSTSTAASSRASTGAGGTGSTDASGAASSTAAVTVISDGSWIVDASVGSSDLPSIKPGLQVQITPSGATQPIFGTVTSAGIVASSSSSGSAQFPVVIAVTGTQTGLYAGTSATASIIVKQLSNVITVPTQAIRTANGKTEVTVVKNGADVATPVTLGEVFGARTEITKGLSSGDEVLVTLFVPSGTSGTTGSTTRGFGGGGFGGAGGTGGFGGGGQGGFQRQNGGQGGGNG